MVNNGKETYDNWIIRLESKIKDIKTLDILSFPYTDSRKALFPAWFNSVAYCTSWIPIRKILKEKANNGN